ncbi:uncharacterized protein BDZ83DRAFT_246554 [Colletotrichum acutatum]|uniref:Uncharacterized protein n=1 Tax=Glomerella acutata TaxID=27357 RepID=A0AAD8XQ33_GLOAC|nr:uncharacterized protein BDZ83DRAFT_246554 [Colletotrichum acutatum]KAK1731339.1 hypothetical protein BDZ83DRAFT_246554 [Colletotrichum acutatum]
MAEMRQSFRHPLTTLFSSSFHSFSCVSRPEQPASSHPLDVRWDSRLSVSMHKRSRADHNPRAAASHYCTPYPSLSSFPSVCTPYGCVPLHHFPLTDCHSHSGTPGACIPACSILIALLLIYPLKVPAVLPFSFPSHL